MKKIIFRKEFVFFLVGIVALSGFHGKIKNDDLVRAKTTLQQIYKLYDAGHDHLLYEFSPDKPNYKVRYLAGKDTITVNRVAYLWPTSGVFSSVNALLRATGDKKYRKLLETQVMPGLEEYHDTLRKPGCYQSYISVAGKSDRYYDDNVWVALDFCESYNLTKKPDYLAKSIKTWQFIISGWDDKLGGGIYWCEQKLRSKNTCSNAPAAVLAFKLFEATRDSSYFKWGSRIYNWTKTTLQDSTDYLYFDSKNLTGRIGRAKYTYNSGQMLQSAAMLYKLTGNKTYLTEAQHIAKSAIDYFTAEYTTAGGKKIRLFKNSGNWFNSILFRGYVELYQLDKNDQYIKVFRDNMDQLWSIRSKSGLFSKDWKGQKEDDFKALLDQSSLVEIWARLAYLD